MDSRTAPSRRTVVKGAGAVALGAVGVGSLAACSDDSAATSAGVTFGDDPAALPSADGSSVTSGAGPTDGAAAAESSAAAPTAGTTGSGAAPAASKSPSKAAAKPSTKAAPTTAEGSTAKASTKPSTTKPAPGATTTKPAPAPPAPPAPAPAPPAPAPPAPAPAGPPAGAIIQVADIPNGGAVSKNGLIISRSGNSVRAFSSKCPHQGCTVAPAGGSLDCPCHGSTFNVSDGSLIQGPATRGLDSASVSVVSGWVVP